MENGKIIKHGDIKVISTDYGISHSEFNDYSDRNVKVLQI